MNLRDFLDNNLVYKNQIETWIMWLISTIFFISF